MGYSEWNSYISTLAFNAWYGSDISRQSDRYRLAATPAGKTFSIWGIIYVQLALALLRGDFDGVPQSEAFMESMRMNRTWVVQFSRGEVESSRQTLRQLILTNRRLVQLTTPEHTPRLPQRVDLLGTYNDWCGLAGFLNDSIYRVHEGGEHDNSELWLREFLKSKYGIPLRGPGELSAYQAYLAPSTFNVLNWVVEGLMENNPVNNRAFYKELNATAPTVLEMLFPLRSGYSSNEPRRSNNQIHTRFHN